MAILLSNLLVFIGCFLCKELVDGEFNILKCYACTCNGIGYSMLSVCQLFSTQLHYSSKPVYNTAEQREYGFYLSLRFNMAATSTCYVCTCFLFDKRQSFRRFDFLTRFENLTHTF